MYLSKFWNVFHLNFKWYEFDHLLGSASDTSIENVFVQIGKCLWLNFLMYLIRIQNDLSLTGCSALPLTLQLKGGLLAGAEPHRRTVGQTQLYIGRTFQIEILPKFPKLFLFSCFLECWREKDESLYSVISKRTFSFLMEHFSDSEDRGCSWR